MSKPDPISADQTEIESVTAVQLDCECGPDPAAISAEMGRAFGVLGEFIGRNRLQPNAPPRAIYTGYGPQGVSITLAIPVEAPPSPLGTGSPVRVGTLPAARTLRFAHHGPYRDLRETYGRITGYLLQEGLIESEADWGRFMPMWEEYLNDPETTPAAELVTHIHLPLP